MRTGSIGGRVAAAVLCVAMAVPAPAWSHGRGGFPQQVPYRLETADTRVVEDLSANPDAVSKEVFVNFESPHVHPMDLRGNLLAVVNTADNRVELFNVSTGVPEHRSSIPVGYDPVSCRFNPFNPDELWVVNHISDSISIVSIEAGHVVRTVQTGDEPADVVFTTFSNPAVANVAVVSCSQDDTLEAYRLSDYSLLTSRYLQGEDPRALAVNAELKRVYAAIFESGNGSTLVRHLEINEPLGPSGQASTHPGNPYGGQNPPYNNGISGDAWTVPGGSRNVNQWIDLGFVPPKVSLIVKRDANGVWRDDNGADWTQWVSGEFQELNGRPEFATDGAWQLLDNDIAIVQGGDGMANPGYGTRLMNLCMAVGVNPATGNVFVVGTDATNEVRFEPNIAATFTRVMVGVVDPLGNTLALHDMNEEHLAAAQGGQAYSTRSVPMDVRRKSIGDPRGIAFSPDGQYAYVAGMGSNNVIVLDANGSGRGLGKRTAVGHTIDVGEGPTGVVYDGVRVRLYVLNRFEASISTIDVSTPGSELEVSRIGFFDPTPIEIRLGRPHLYDTHRNSGLGQISCASCHVDARMDRLAWDLGNPIGEIKPVTANGLLVGGIPGVHNTFKPFGPTDAHFDDFHPMKGPMTTQTLIDIIGKEPHHWRGDRDGIEEFADAFEALQGGDAPLDAVSMQELEAFLASLHFGPNPLRAIDNTLAGGPSFDNVPGTDQPKFNPVMQMRNQFATGRFALSPGAPLPAGNAWNGFRLYTANFRENPPPNVPFRGLDSFAQCIECHTLPTGAGSTHFTSDDLLDDLAITDFVEIPPGPNGEAHLAMVSQDGTGQRHFKTPQLRNQLDKEGLFITPGHASRAGFGTVHDGAAAGVAEFLSSPVFSFVNDQELADVAAFVLSISGGFEDLKPLFPTIGLPSDAIPGPPGADSTGAHAAVGHQVTLRTTPSVQDLEDEAHAVFGKLLLLLEIADRGWIDIVAHGVQSGKSRGWSYVSGTGGGAVFQGERRSQTLTYGELTLLAAPGAEMTFTVVPPGLGERLGIDRDADGAYRQDELDLGADPAYAGDNVWVDSGATGVETGRPEHPFNTVAEGLAALQPKAGATGVLHLFPGSYAESVSISTPTVLVAEGGSAVIGL